MLSNTKAQSSLEPKWALYSFLVSISDVSPSNAITTSAFARSIIFLYRLYSGPRLLPSIAIPFDGKRIASKEPSHK